MLQGSRRLERQVAAAALVAMVVTTVGVLVVCLAMMGRHLAPLCVVLACWR